MNFELMTDKEIEKKKSVAIFGKWLSIFCIFFSLSIFMLGILAADPVSIVVGMVFACLNFVCYLANVWLITEIQNLQSVRDRSEQQQRIDELYGRNSQ